MLGVLGSKKELLGKIRSNKKAITNNRNFINGLKVRVNALDPLLEAIQEELEVLKQMIGEKPPEEPGNLPLLIRDADDLRQFVKSHPDLGEEWAKEYVYEKKIKCAAVRDALAQTYPDIERINDQQERHSYTRDEEGHRDAVLVIVDPADPARDKVYDFCIASSSAGIFRDSICWNYQPITPW